MLWRLRPLPPMRVAGSWINVVGDALAPCCIAESSCYIPFRAYLHS